MSRKFVAAIAIVASWTAAIAHAGGPSHLVHDCVGGCDYSSTCDGFGDHHLGRMKLLGCLKPSDHCFDDFISPMINFVFFEDPRTLTELRPIFVHHEFPEQVGPANLDAGGSIQLYALQFRLALSERLSLIAVKDGYIVDNIDDGPVDGLIDDGWADVSVGLKYNLFRDPSAGRLLSIGGTYEIPVGTRRAAQAIGDGEFHVFGSAGQRLLDGDSHYLTGFGYRFPIDGDLQSSAYHWSHHLDFRLTDRLYAFTELAWWHWDDAADDGLAIGVSGQDLLNLSASDVQGNDLVTQNVGAKYRWSRNVIGGIAYEFPTTGFEDVISERLQLEMILRY